MFPLNILVFPCGSEVALEIYRSMRYSRHFNLIGGNSVEDHGKFVFSDYIGDMPFYNHPDFIPALKKIILNRKIDLLYPAMDSVITMLKSREDELGCRVIASPVETTQICLSKSKTYDALKAVIKVPEQFSAIESITSYPVFIKPDIGYGSRGAQLVLSKEELASCLKKNETHIVLEYLPGNEYTIDCFTDKEGKLLFAGPRMRKRVVNGISVNTSTLNDRGDELESIAKIINQNLNFRGAWFFQMKENRAGELVLLEVASRLGGSSAVYRCKGINFALMSAFDVLGLSVEAFPNNFDLEMDRALDNKYKINIGFETVYFDLDDTIINKDYLNPDIIKFIITCLNRKIKVILLTKHADDLTSTLNKHRISALFDEIIHIGKSDKKSDYITDTHSIFIDDSFEERKNVFEKKGIAVFSPDAVECLL